MKKRKQKPAVALRERHPYTYLYQTVAGRRLNKSQLAFVALAAMEKDFKIEAERRKKLGKKVVGTERGSAASLAGQHIGVSSAYVKYAARIRSENPGLASEVENGHVTIPDALRRLKKKRALPASPRRIRASREGRREMRVNARVEDLRMALNETQTTFGKRFGVTASCISLWEQCDREPGGPARIMLGRLEAEHAAELRDWKSRKVKIWKTVDGGLPSSGRSN